MSNQGMNGVFTFGGKDAPEGTVEITIDLVRETEEYGRQLAMRPQAMYPQMESLVARKVAVGRGAEDGSEDEDGQEKVIMSLASCGFGQLALMDDVPEQLADEYSVPKFGFRASSVVNISEKILSTVGEMETVVLTEAATAQLQEFLILYAQAVWRVESPLVIMIAAKAVQESEYGGSRWFTFPVAFITSVDQEEWLKLYDLKKLELEWADKIKTVMELKAKLTALEAIQKSQHRH